MKGKAKRILSKNPGKYIDWVKNKKMSIFNVLEANRVKVGFRVHLGVLRGADSKSAVCPAVKGL